MLRNALLSSVALFGCMNFTAGSVSAYDHHGGYGRYGGHHHHHSGYSQVQVYRQPVVVVQRYSQPVSTCQHHGYVGQSYGGYSGQSYGGYGGQSYGGYGGGYGSPYGGISYGGGPSYGFYYSR